MKEAEIQIRVRYGDTDRLGIVYYGSYPLYFEIARTEYMRMKGFTYRELEERGYFLVVVEMHIKYYGMATYDDLLVVKTSLKEIRSRALTFFYKVFKDEELIVEGETHHICINKERKVVQLPSFFLDILKNGRY